MTLLDQFQQAHDFLVLRSQELVAVLQVVYRSCNTKFFVKLDVVVFVLMPANIKHTLAQ